MKSRPPRNTSEKAGAGTIVISLVVLAALLVLPAMALHRRAVDLRWAAACVAVVSLLAYWANARDKRFAVNGEWRISEARLHFWELIGGWPGAWIAQRVLRHKCSKVSYQVVFWFIVLSYQFAAFDSLHDWQLSRAGIQWIKKI